MRNIIDRLRASAGAFRAGSRGFAVANERAVELVETLASEGLRIDAIGAGLVTAGISAMRTKGQSDEDAIALLVALADQLARAHGAAVRITNSGAHAVRGKTTPLLEGVD